MTNIDVVIERLDAQSKKIDKMEQALTRVADQSIRIDNLAEQSARMWRWAATTDNKISNIEKFQASCPRDIQKENHDKLENMVTTNLKSQWVILTVLVLSLVGMFWKVS